MKSMLTYLAVVVQLDHQDWSSFIENSKFVLSHNDYMWEFETTVHCFQLQTNFQSSSFIVGLSFFQQYFRLF